MCALQAANSIQGANLMQQTHVFMETRSQPPQVQGVGVTLRLPVYINPAHLKCAEKANVSTVTHFMKGAFASARSYGESG